MAGIFNKKQRKKALILDQILAKQLQKVHQDFKILDLTLTSEKRQRKNHLD